MGGFEEVVFTGMEFVRSDWTLAAKNFQKELYERIFFKKPYREWMRSFVEDLWAGKMNADLVYKKRLTKPVDEYIRNIPPHVKAAKIFIEQTDVLDVQIYRYNTFRSMANLLGSYRMTTITMSQIKLSLMTSCNFWAKALTMSSTVSKVCSTSDMISIRSGGITMKSQLEFS